VNITTAGSVATSLGIATGNTLEPLAGAYLVNCFANGTEAFDRAEDVLKYVVLAGFLSTTISATFGVTSLVLGGYADWSHFGLVWATWWLGDAGGDIIAAPFFILLWRQRRKHHWNRAKMLEAAFFGSLLIYLTLVVF